ncbi:MAG: DUF3987 domain-containing protein [Sphingomicrobium sp.]
MADALGGVGDAPVQPLDAVVSFPEPTLEGLHKYLAIGQPSMGLFSDEGGMFVGGVGMSKENVLKSAAGFSHLWDGAPVKRLRSLDGATVLFGRRVSLHLMLQPEAAARWLAVAGAVRLADEGWAAKALALGWDELELFGAVPDADGDPAGDGLAVWLNGRELLAMTADYAVAAQPGGWAYFNRRQSSGAVLLWALGRGR